MTRELKVDAEKLAAEVAWLNRMPTSTPETAVIQVTALLSALLLRKTCFDQYREVVMPVEGAAQATALVDAGKLVTALKTVSGRVTITVGDDELAIKDSDRTVRLKAADTAVEFPQWPQFEGRGKEVVSSREMEQALTSVGTDDSLPQLTIVAFDNGKMVTTDRFRLSAITYDTSGFTGKVPSSVLYAFTKANTAVFVEAGSCTGENAEWVELRSGTRTVTAPMSDAEFPKWRKLIPETPPLRVVMPRADLLKAVTGEEITLVIDGEVMTVTSESDGMATEQKIGLYQTIRNTLDGPFTVTLRSKYVKDCLKGIGSGLVLIEASESVKPVMFQDVGESDLHLIMPVRGANAS
jgi:DNA polymerase III sliding clamp (beta) subunit (PCNA family)